MTANPWAHRLFLVALTCLLTLPNLGGPALWDMDEGVNADLKRVNIRSDVVAAGARLSAIRVDPTMVSFGLGYRF